MIPFNKPYLTGSEGAYIAQAFATGHLCGNGDFTKRCQAFFEKRYGFRKALLTTSGTDALEMAALLTGVGPGDEVIVPSYTFVSTALAFIRTGATVVFADSRADEPNLDATALAALITPRTKVIVPVHYAGCACDMDAIMSLAAKHDLLVVEDAAQAVDAFYIPNQTIKQSNNQTIPQPLGGIGHIGCFSFHETKNINCGEGGLLVVNDERFIRRSEIIWEKGTNRSEFFRGMVNKYGWVDIGSSFLAPETTAAFLWAQLEQLDDIQARRRAVWQRYWDVLSKEPCVARAHVRLPLMPAYATNNAHMFYLLFPTLAERTTFMSRMKEQGVQTTFHYLPLHTSEYYRTRHDGRALPNCDRYADCLVRLPLYGSMTVAEQDAVLAAVRAALG